MNSSIVSIYAFELNFLFEITLEYQNASSSNIRSNQARILTEKSIRWMSLILKFRVEIQNRMRTQNQIKAKSNFAHLNNSLTTV